MRLGAHPVGAVLHLKHDEGILKNGKPIRAKSVTAETGQHAKKLETKSGWNFPSPDDDWVRGYSPEVEDFVEAMLADREPVSGIDLVRDVVETIYARICRRSEDGGWDYAR